LASFCFLTTDPDLLDTRYFVIVPLFSSAVANAPLQVKLHDGKVDDHVDEIVDAEVMHMAFDTE
jgi:hypothetical protein